jgi:hypothetical protein
MAGFKFYKKHGIEVGHYFLDSVISDIDSLILYAGVHRKIAGFHFMVSRRFPFAIYYKIEDDVVRIRRILDCRKDPNWIKKALKRHS